MKNHLSEKSKLNNNRSDNTINNNQFYSLINSQIYDIESMIEYENNEEDDYDIDVLNTSISCRRSDLSFDRAKNILSKYYESLLKCREEMNVNLRSSIDSKRSVGNGEFSKYSLSHRNRLTSKYVDNKDFSNNSQFISKDINSIEVSSFIFNNNNDNISISNKSNINTDNYTYKGYINKTNQSKINKSKKRNTISNPVKTRISNTITNEVRPERRVGDWVCCSCSNHNFSFRKRCNRCNKDRQY